MGFFSKIAAGLQKTRQQLTQALQSLVGRSALTPEFLEYLEECLIASDMGVDIATSLIDKLRKSGIKELDKDQLIELLQKYTLEYLPPFLPPPHITSKPQVILVLGVNGVGKTTSIAKLAHYYKSQGHSVLVAAADTFRAGAIEQLAEWCNRVQVDLVRHQAGSDASAVAFDAYQAAKSRNHSLLLIDTAGRLHNKEGLMEELKKMVRVLQKHAPELPHETLLVLDAHTGQNALAQAVAFNAVHPIQGLVITKLDGTAKGGALLSVTHQTKIPVKWIGVGESLSDLLPFDQKSFANGLFSEVEVATSTQSN